jgi:hypothetical protein
MYYIRQLPKYKPFGPAGKDLPTRKIAGKQHNRVWGQRRIHNALYEETDHQGTGLDLPEARL